MATILIAEDDPQLRLFLRLTLEGSGYVVLEAHDGVEALELARTQPVSAIVADAVMPRMGGRELIWRLSEIAPHIPAILVSGMLDPDHVDKVVSSAAYLGKPFSREEILDAVARALASS